MCPDGCASSEFCLGTPAGRPVLAFFSRNETSVSASVTVATTTSEFVLLGERSRVTGNETHGSAQGLGGGFRS